LVVPREHIPDAHHVGPEHGDILAELFTTAQTVADAEGLSGRGYRLVLNVGAEAGNTVPHLHLHVMGGRPMAWPPG
ncbi:MAG TPA: HIT domain-containing protein, partial [Acidimicrobiales bacterium]|nr:HIT domain-containing protein [Acidimicrobiales bacterium]